MNKQENIYSLKGFDKVFRFTVRQTFKNKAYITSFVMFVLIMTFMGPIQYASFMAGSSAAGDMINYSPQNIGIEKLYVLNQTDVPVDIDSLEGLYTEGEEAEGLTKSNVIFETVGSSDSSSSLGNKDAVLIFGFGESGYKVSIVASDDTELKVSELDEVSGFAAEKFDAARLSSTGIGEDDIKMLQQGIDGEGIYTEKEYAKEDSKTLSQSKYFGYIMGYSIILMIVMVMSSSYIITNVNEEKQSKLVESILVSVRPMALLLGKITGMMSYVVLVLVCGMTGSAISNAVLDNVFHAKESGFEYSGLSVSMFTENGPAAAAVLLISILLGFLSFGLLSGLFGSACNQPEDVQSATSSVMLVCMLGYFAGIGAGSGDSDKANLIFSLIPPFSYYVSPVAFVAGRIPFYIWLISVVLQIAVVVAIAVLSAKTYRNLLLRSNGKPKLSEILKAAKEG